MAGLPEFNGRTTFPASGRKCVRVREREFLSEGRMVSWKLGFEQGKSKKMSLFVGADCKNGMSKCVNGVQNS